MKAQIVITLEDDGKVNVAGPIADQVLTFGLIEIAKNSVRQFNEDRLKQKPDLVIAPAGSIPGRTH